MELYRLTVHQARSLLDKGEISATELTRAVLQRIDAVDARVKAYLTVVAERALEQARQADARWALPSQTCKACCTPFSFNMRLK